MFPCNFKIQGYSGTDFKHRKPFQKLKEHLNKKKRTGSATRKVDSNFRFKNKKTTPFSRNTVDRSLKWLFAVVRLSLFVLIFLLVKNVVETVNTVNTELTTNSRVNVEDYKYYKGLTNMEIYRHLIATGNDYLKANKLDEAHKTFAKAWNMDRYGFEANLGMTKTLVKKCAQTGQYCHEAEDYFNYMKKVTKLPDIELNDIEKLFVAQ